MPQGKQLLYKILYSMWEDTRKENLTLFGLGFWGSSGCGGIFSSPLPNFCSRSDNDLKLCGKVVYHQKVSKNFSGVDDVIIFDDISIFIDFVCCQLLVIF